MQCISYYYKSDVLNWLAGRPFIVDKNLEFYIEEFVMHIEEKEERFAMLVLSHPWV